jgi:predicted AlkP superfamily pyrophosphatase or phosphodiesterase
VSLLQINYKKMKYYILILLFVSNLVFAQKSTHASKPKLIVGVVLDQMRPDFLARFEHRFSNKGFNLLVNEGNVCENTMINYLPAYTAPGHACIYTGSVPALHGISSNDWIDRITGNQVYCTQDASVNAVGGTVKAGKMSPKNLWASTITDELRLSSNFKSKVIAISVKDRASILPGGHTSNGSYWMDDSNGVFMTSSFYMTSLPKWVEDFNKKGLAKQYMMQEWNTLMPIETYTNSTSDQNNYEGKFAGESTTTFPHKTSGLKINDIKKTPFGNDIVLDFAKEAIVQEALGQGDETDFLAISFSSTDYIGHMYGPNAIELEDTYLRMDKTIEELIQALNKQVGEGNYTLFLTSDHGVAHNPQFLLDHKLPAGFFIASTMKSNLNKHLAQIFPSANLVKDVAENFIWLNDAAIDSVKLDKQLVINEILKSLKYYAEIHFAVDMHNYSNVLNTLMPSQLKEMATNGHVNGRSGDILLLLKPAWLDAYAKTGSTHGTWNPYDTHIPLIWYGWGIQKGTTKREVYMTDIAATLASILHIQMPNACIGKPIVEVIK